MFDRLEAEKMVLVGATAVEDRLQEAVPETLRILSAAGIKIWMLTGDHVDTAISIGRSCGLIPSTDPDIIKLTAGVAINGTLNEEISQPSILILDGSAAEQILSDPTRAAKFAQLSADPLVIAVICARISPNQQGQLVELVQERFGNDLNETFSYLLLIGKVCLAIGDGANDVGMIRQANIGNEK